MITESNKTRKLNVGGDVMEIITPSENWEPKTKNRFIVYYGDLPKYAINRTDLPSLETNRLGRHWKNIHMELYDPICPSASQGVQKLFEADDKEVIDAKIALIGPLGETVSEWMLYNVKIVTADFGTLDWSDSTANIIKLEVKYDYAHLEF